MKKTIFILIILILLPFYSIKADDSNQSYTIEEAQTIALSSSKQLGLDNLDIQAKESALKYAKDPNSYPSFNLSEQERISSLVNQGVNPITAGANLEVSKRNKELHAHSIKLDVYKACMGLMLAQKDLERNNSILAIMNENLEIAKRQFDVGIITETDLDNVEYNVDSKKTDVETAMDKVKSSALQLKKLLDLPLDNSKISIKDEFMPVKIGSYDIESLIQNTIEKDIIVYQKTMDIKAKETAFNINKNYYFLGDAIYDQAKFDLETAKSDIDDYKNTMEVNIRNKFNDFLTIQDKVELAIKYADLTEKKFKISEIKYNNGMMSKDSYLKDKQKFLDAQYQKFVGIHDFNITKAEFENMINQ